MRLRLIAIASLVALPMRTRAQVPAATPAPKPISDNSFLVEEAYNQERGVVQHISNVRRARDASWLITFTQEWPAPNQRHQLSYTVPVQGGGGGGSGAGDLVLNYRYQAVGRDEEPVWFAPRLSLLLPTGSVSEGRGAGGPGLQVNLPVSIGVSPVLVTHWNLGATATRARAASGARATTRGYNAAASAIWLMAPAFNLMLESSWDRGEQLDALGGRSSEDHFVVLPGARAAINLPSGMQIVPGIGVPIGVGPSRGERDLFLYLSVEHAFR